MLNDKPPELISGKLVFSMPSNNISYNIKVTIIQKESKSRLAKPISKSDQWWLDLNPLRHTSQQFLIMKNKVCIWSKHSIITTVFHSDQCCLSFHHLYGKCIKKVKRELMKLGTRSTSKLQLCVGVPLFFSAWKTNKYHPTYKFPWTGRSSTQITNDLMIKYTD